MNIKLSLTFFLLDDDDEKLREELKDLIDDNPIEEDESEGEDSDGSRGSKKRKKSDDEDFDDRLEDEDYDLLEENLGVKVERKVCYSESINQFIADLIMLKIFQYLHYFNFTLVEYIKLHEL